MTETKKNGKSAGLGRASNSGRLIRENTTVISTENLDPSQKGIRDVTNTFSPPPSRKNDGDGKGS